VIFDDGVKVDPISVYAKTEHVFAEGPELLLSDVMIFPIYYIIHHTHNIMQNYPYTLSWYNHVTESSEALIIMSELIHELDSGNSNPSLMPAIVPEESLYKCDPARNSKQTTKFYTKQSDVNIALDWWSDCGIESLQQYQLHDYKHLVWDELPKLVHPLAGSLPPERHHRKCGQLSSLAVPLASIAKPGDIVVDFCSGGGHLGLLVSHLAPKSIVHMVENKEESLARARERGVGLRADNVWFFQCNLDYYIGTFEVGSSLHACGVATDLVIEKCTQNRASFVCCPCCYGGIQTLDSLKYPRSKMFTNMNVTQSSYFVIAHSADQTHAGGEKCEQGKLCMDIVDTDRGLGVKEKGYNVTLSKLEPKDCTPKNNLLIGIPDLN